MRIIKQLLIGSFIFFLGLSNSSAQNYNVSLIPKSLLEEANAVLRIDENYFTIISAGKGKFRSKWAYTILNAKAEELAELYLGYDKLNFYTKISGTLYDASGNEIKKLKTSDIRDFSAYDGFTFVHDDRIKLVSLKHHQYPYTVEFETEEIYNGLLFYENWNPVYRDDVAVEKSFFKVIVPQSLELRYKESNFDFKANINYQSTQVLEENLKSYINTVKISTEGSSSIYYWEAANLPVFKPEPFGSSGRDFFPSVRLAPNDFEFGGYKGNMSSWESFGYFQYQLNQKRDILTEEGKAKIKEITKDCPDDLCKIQRVYEYMQSKTRYVGIQLGVGGWQPFEASYVDEKGYGDCKALSNYTYTLLKEAGVKSYYTLIYAGEYKIPLDKDFACRQFNHAVLCVPMQNDTIWLECTSQTEGIGYAGDFTGDRDALMITPEGGKVVHTPVYTKKDNLLTRNAEVVVDIEGNIKANITTLYKALQEGDRAYCTYQSKEVQQKWLYDNIDIPNFEIQEFELKRAKGIIPVTTEILKISAPKLASKSGKRLFIIPNLMNQFNEVPPTIEERKSEVILSSDYDFKDIDTIQYQIPDSYKIEFKPEDTKFNSKFGSYEMTLKFEGNKLIYIRKFEMNRGKFPKETYSELVEFLKNVAKADKNKVVFVQSM